MTDVALSQSELPIAPKPLLESLTVTRRQLEIMDELQSYILEFGFRDLTVERMAAQLRCSRATLYSLAATKGELVALVIDRLFQLSGRKAATALARVSGPDERLQTYLRVTNGELRRGKTQFWADVHDDPAIGRLVEQHYGYSFRVIKHIIREGIAVGAFRQVNPDVVAEILRASLEALRHPKALARVGMSNSSANEELFSILFAGLRA